MTGKPESAGITDFDLWRPFTFMALSERVRATTPYVLFVSLSVILLRFGRKVNRQYECLKKNRPNMRCGLKRSRSRAVKRNHMSR
jgi:RNase P protein component